MSLNNNEQDNGCARAYIAFGTFFRFLQNNNVK